MLKHLASYLALTKKEKENLKLNVMTLAEYRYTLYSHTCSEKNATQQMKLLHYNDSIREEMEI